MTALEGTNLILYNINETTLIKWYKDDVQKDKIQMLLQGLPPSQHQLVDRNALSPAKELPSAPVNPHTFTEAEDTSGQAVLRKKTKSSSHPPAGSGPTSNPTPDLIDITAVNPTTDPTDPTAATIPAADPTLDPTFSTPDHPPQVPQSQGQQSGSIRKRERGGETSQDT